MKRLIFILIVLFAATMLWVTPEPAICAFFPAPIEYQETLTVILEEGDFQGWPTDYETAARAFLKAAVAANGTKIGFVVRVPVLNSYVDRLFEAQPDGSNVEEITPSEWWSGPFEMDDNGNRLFFRHYNETTGRDEIHFVDLASNGVATAVTGILGMVGKKPYSIKGDGTQICFKHNAGWNETTQRNEIGLYCTGVSGLPPDPLTDQIMHMESLPCDEVHVTCDWNNTLTTLGLSGNGVRFLFRWDENFWTGKQSLYYAGSGGGGPVRRPDEIQPSVWSLQDVFNHIISWDGSTALYYVWDLSAPKANAFYAVDLGSGEKTLLGYIKPDGYVAVSPSGNYVLTSGFGYDENGFTVDDHNATRINVQNLDKRDTGSYYIRMFNCGPWRSDTTLDDRYYFLGGSCPGHPARVYRVDMAPDAFLKAPNIKSIHFSASGLLHQDGATIAVEVEVSDAQGLGNLEWVQLTTLIEGKEDAPFYIGRTPLAYPVGDPGSTFLYDDGTHGDRVAGDGVFTFDQIATRKGDYDGWNTWYSHYTLPADVGIRVIAKDLEENYTIADTQLTIGESIGDITPKGALVSSVIDLLLLLSD